MKVSIAAKSTALESLVDAALSNPGDLPRHVEALGGLRLLAESSDEIGEKGERYAKAVDNVFSTAFRIADRPQAADRAAGTGLLEVACQHCSTKTFLQCFPAWSAQLLTILKNHREENQPWRALCAILNRAAGLISVQGIHQEVASLATRVAGAVTPLLRQKPDDSGTCQDPGPAVDTVIAAVSAAPAAFRSHLKPLEEYAACGLVDPRSSISSRRHAAHLLSLLPSITGGVLHVGKVEQWSSLFQVLLTSAHHQLEALYSGLQDSQAAAAYRMGLLPGAKALQSTTSGDGLVLNDSTARTTVQSLAAVLDCIERLMSQSAAQPVPMPAAGIAMLCSRILSVDDSLIATGKTPSSASAYQVLLAAFPGMHASAYRLLRLLASVCKGGLTPMYAGLIAIASSSLQRVASEDSGSFASGSLPPLRSEVYEYTSVVLQHAGWGAVRDLTAPVMQCLLLELYSDAAGRSSAQQPPEASGKKRKRQKAQQQQQQADLAALAKGAPTPGSFQAYDGPSGLEVLHQAASQIAALSMVQTLLEVGGAFVSLEARAQLDAIVAHQASTAAAAVQRQARSGAAAAAAPGALHLAALQALLVSVLAPCRHAPPFLPHALTLFSQGQSSSIPEVHAFSVQALAACEALIHPRCPRPWPSPAASQQPPRNGKAPDAAEYLGIPRMWASSSMETGTRQMSALQVQHSTLQSASHESALPFQSVHMHPTAADQQDEAAASPSSTAYLLQPEAQQPADTQPLKGRSTAQVPHEARPGGVPSALGPKQGGPAGTVAGAGANRQGGQILQDTSPRRKAIAKEQAPVQAVEKADTLEPVFEAFQKAPQGAGSGHSRSQAGRPQDGKASADMPKLPELAESDSEGSMPLIDSGNESDMEDASSDDE